MPSLWFVTPVHRRERLTRICLEQRARLIAELAGLGVSARQLVIGDDAGLLFMAHALGFHVMGRPNVLGLRINDGFEWACRERGADYVVYVGSDDWMLPGPLADLPAPGRVRASAWNTWVSADGRSIASVDHPPALGNAPWTVSRAALEPLGFRPVRDGLMSGIDTSMADNLGDVFDFHPEDDPLRWVGFKSGGEQLTPWELQVPNRFARGRVFETLATRYPADLCARMEEFYAR